jgi:SAM-dependent methyltransferase
MSGVVAFPVTENRIKGAPKDKSCMLNVMGRYLRMCGVDTEQPVLVLGGGQEDQEILNACGFQHIVLSNLDAAGQALDAEDIALPDNSYPVVFAHAILHHCRCPHRAVGEMVRVAQQHVFFLEPNDSLALRLLTRAGFSFPYELAAVAAQGYLRGGLRDGPVPNYIYRWTGREVSKCVAAYHPERQFDIRAHPFWDFYVNEYELLSRKESRVAWLAQTLGPSNLIDLPHLGQAVLNLFPPPRAQGNKFFCAISKGELQPWIEAGEGNYSLRKAPH